MAIHIDIYAHIKERELVKEGEKLKAYVDHLERDINTRLERGAVGPSNKIIALNDRQSASFDTLVNKSDSVIKAFERLGAARKKVIDLQEMQVDDDEQEEKRLKALEHAIRDVADAEQDLVYRAQQMSKATNDLTRNTKLLTEENQRHKKEQRDLRDLVTYTEHAFGDLMVTTSQHRSELKRLHKENVTAIQDNKGLVRQLDAVTDKTKKTTKERRALGKLLKSDTLDLKGLRGALDSLINTHEAENKSLVSTIGNLKEFATQHQHAMVTVKANKDSLREWSAEAATAKQQIKALLAANEDTISSNAGLSKSFKTAADDIESAFDAHKKYNQEAHSGLAEQEKLNKSIAGTDRAYARQRDSTEAAIEGLKDYRANAHKVATQIGKNKKEFADLTRVTNKQRNDLMSLVDVHRVAIKDSASFTRQLDAQSAATEKTAASRKKYNDMLKEGGYTYKQLKAAGDDFRASVANERQVLGRTADQLHELVLERTKHDVVVNANKDSLRDLSREAVQNLHDIRALRQAYGGVIDNNTGLTRSFDSVENALTAAVRGHKEYNGMTDDSSVSQDKLRKKIETVTDDYVRMRGATRKATEGLAEQLAVHKEFDDVVEANRQRLENLTTSAEANRLSLQKLAAVNRDAIHESRGVAGAFNAATEAMHRNIIMQAEHDRMIEAGTADKETMIRRTESFAESLRKESNAMAKAKDELHRYRDAEAKRTVRGGGYGGGGGGPGGVDRDFGRWAARNLGALTPLGTVTPILVAPIGILFNEIANAAVAASQAISLLPAALTAGAAAFGTIQMATAGFSDTIKALMSGDLEKFATLIQNLAPSAQQTALTIQYLLPQIQGIQKAVQEAFFQGAPQMGYALFRSFGPMVQDMTTSIATSMNKAMMGVGDMLLTPKGMNDIESITANITKTFQQLEPVVTAVASAFLDLTRVGSAFLPIMADDIAEVAKNFATFISNARDSGELRAFMYEGWEAIKAVGAALLNFGKMLYDVFGLKSQQDVQKFRDTMQGMTDGVELVLRVLKSVFEDLVGFFKQIADFLDVITMGTSTIQGWSDALAFVADAWIFMHGIKWARDFLGIVKEIKIEMGAIALLNAAGGGGGVVPIPGGGGGGAAAGAKGLLARLFGGSEALFGVAAGAAPAVAVNAAGDATIMANIGALGTSLAGLLGPVTIATGAIVALGAAAKWAVDKISMTDFNESQPAVYGPNGQLTAPGGAPIPGMLPGTGGIPFPDLSPGDLAKLKYMGVDDPHAIPIEQLYRMLGRPIPKPEVAPPPPGMYRPHHGTQLEPIPGSPQSKVLDPNWPGPFAVPPAPPDKLHPFQAPPGSYELANIPVGQFPGAQFQVPPGIMDLQPDYQNLGKTGFYRPDPYKIYQEQNKVDTARQSAEEARIALLEEESKAVKDQDQINKLAHNVQEQERAWIDSVHDLKLAERGEFVDLTNQTRKFADDLKDSLGDLGAALDPDLGISKGLAGIADNLVRFVATLGAAPVLGAMKGMQAGLGFPGNKGVGSGLVGIIAAQHGYYQSPYSNEDRAKLAEGQRYGIVTPTPGGPVPTAVRTPGIAPPAGQAAPGESARDFAHRVMMPFFQRQGLTVGDHEADQYGEHQQGALDIMVNSIEQGNQVLQQVLSDPNVYGAIFNHQAYGYGQGTQGRPYTGPNPHTDHVHAFYQPGRQGDIIPIVGPDTAGIGGTNFNLGAPGSVVSPSALAGVGGVVSVAVTNWPASLGGTAGAGAPGATGAPGTPGSGIGGTNFNLAAPGAPAATGPTPGGLNWDALAAKEASGNWANTSNPKYSGGLQFDAPTWAQYGGTAYAPSAAQATKEQQIAVANAALSSGRTPASLWPQNWQQLYAGKVDGGQLSGPGTGTSDSMLIRASDGEFVVNEKATQKYLPLLEALNAKGYQTGGEIGGPTLPGDPLTWLQQNLGSRGGGFNPDMPIDTSNVTMQNPLDNFLRGKGTANFYDRERLDYTDYPGWGEDVANMPSSNPWVRAYASHKARDQFERWRQGRQGWWKSRQPPFFAPGGLVGAIGGQQGNAGSNVASGFLKETWDQITNLVAPDSHPATGARSRVAGAANGPGPLPDVLAGPLSLIGAAGAGAPGVGQAWSALGASAIHSEIPNTGERIGAILSDVASMAMPGPMDAIGITDAVTSAARRAAFAGATPAHASTDLAGFQERMAAFNAQTGAASFDPYPHWDFEGNPNIPRLEYAANVQHQRLFNLQAVDPVMNMMQEFSRMPEPPVVAGGNFFSPNIAKPVGRNYGDPRAPESELNNLIEGTWVLPETWAVYRDYIRSAALRAHREGYKGLHPGDLPEALDLGRATQAAHPYGGDENLPATDEGIAFANIVGQEMQARVAHGVSMPDTWMRGLTLTPEQLMDYAPGNPIEMPISSWSTSARLAHGVAGDPGHRSSLRNIMSEQEMASIFENLASGARPVVLQTPFLQGASVGSGETVSGGLFRSRRVVPGKGHEPHRIFLQQEGTGYKHGGVAKRNSGYHMLPGYAVGGEIKLDKIFPPPTPPSVPGGIAHGGGSYPGDIGGNIDVNQPPSLFPPPAAPPPLFPPPAKPAPSVQQNMPTSVDPGLTPPTVPTKTLDVPAAPAGPAAPMDFITPALAPGGIQPAPGVPTPGSTVGAAVEPPQGYGPGLSTGGGLLGMLLSGAASAAGAAASGAAGGMDAGAGGAALSALLQVGIQEIERAIKFAGQATAIGVQGLEETFLPAGGSELAQSNWLTRIVGGIAGAAPAIANVAGGVAQDQLGKGQNLPGVGPSTPEQIAAQALDPLRTQQTGTGYAPGPVNNTGVNIENYYTQDNRPADQDLGRFTMPNGQGR